MRVQFARGGELLHWYLSEVYAPHPNIIYGFGGDLTARAQINVWP